MKRFTLLLLLFVAACSIGGCGWPIRDHVQRVAFKPTPKLQLIVFTSPACDGCERFKRDFARNSAGLRDTLESLCAKSDQGTPFLRVEYSALGWSDAQFARQFEQATGAAVPAMPTFWIRGRQEFVNGYGGGPDSVIGYVVGRPPAEPTIAEPEPDPVPIIAEPEGHIVADATPDWSVVTVNVLASDHTPRLLGLFKGPIKRRLEALSGGKATLNVIPQRTMPVRYQACVQVAGVEPSPLSVVITIGKQPRGLIKGMIAGKIERQVAGEAAKIGHEQKIPVEAIFQRVNPHDFAAFVRAVNTAEPEPAVSVADDTLKHRLHGFIAGALGGGGIVGVIGRLLYTRMRRRLRRRRGQPDSEA